MPSDLLQTDCSRCAALCCVATTFAPSADFPVAKAMGQPCRNLGPDARCRIHDRLTPAGWQGCVAFDCLGAGQRITARRGDWRGASPADQAATFDAWHRLLTLHELLFFLEAGAALAPAAPGLAALQAEVAAAAAQDTGPADEGRRLRAAVNTVLLDISARHRRPAGPDHRRAMLLGRRMRGARLARADLFAACLIGADLRGADLRGADLRGTDLRGSDLRGADLRGALFLRPGQLSSATTDETTRIP